jgi:multidrug efflux pump
MVVSLTTTPMMCSRLLKHHREEDQGWFYRASGKVLNGIVEASTNAAWRGCSGIRPSP